MPFVAVVVAALVTMLPAAAEAANLGPTKASQLVTLLAFGSCPIPFHSGANSFLLSRMVGSDGVAKPLVIPPKKVLVLTDATVTTASVSAGNVMVSAVSVGTAADGSVVAARYDTATTGGVATASFQFPAGVAVRSGTVACVEMINFSAGGFAGATGVAHGYFAPDK